MEAAVSHMLSSKETLELNARFKDAPTKDVLRWAWDTFGKKAAIGTSFQGAGIVMMHIAKGENIPLPVFTLDTGLLFPETIELKSRLEKFLDIKIEALEPEFSVEKQAEIKGPELWKRDPDGCCTLRKVEPLQKKLQQLDCWITGLRRQQSDVRSTTDIVEVYEFDPIMNREIVKLNPMTYWKREDVWDYLKKNKIPYNPLQDQGYRSIGCIPCTSKSASGENERAGRWTGFNKTECGIHTFMKKAGEPGGLGDKGSGRN
jgi:phosphoadenosine phosphosulfate reductase